MLHVADRLRRLDRPTLAVLAMLLAADGVFIALFGALKLGLLQEEALHLGTDGGPAEVLQYAKLFWAGLGLLWVARHTREPVFGAFGALALGLLLDDALMLHEYWGLRIAEALQIGGVAGLRPSDIGEVLFLGAWVGPALLGVFGAYLRSDVAARGVARVAALGLAVLAGFGVGVDALHQIVITGVESWVGGVVHGLDSAFVLLEEGGEHLVMSGLAAGAFHLAMTARPPTPAGPDRPATAADPAPQTPARPRPAALRPLVVAHEAA